MSITGEHLQFLRYCKKEKQTTLAKKLNVKQQAVSKMEKSTLVSDERFEQYVTALGLSRQEAIKMLHLYKPAS